MSCYELVKNLSYSSHGMLVQVMSFTVCIEYILHKLQLPFSTAALPIFLDNSIDLTGIAGSPIILPCDVFP